MARLRRRPALFINFTVVLLALGFAAAVLWWFTQLPTLRLTRLGFADLPGWAAGDPRPALDAFRRSCAVLGKTSPAASMGGAGYAGTAKDWAGVCAALPPRADAVSARRFFERNFVPFAVRGRGASLFTGYYEPQIQGSRTRHGAFETPVYGRPNNLVAVDLGQFSPDWNGEHIAGRVVGPKLVPYATRAEIDRHGVAGAPILFFANDPIAVFFLQIQGSGRVRFDDGEEERVVYDGQNGRPYTAIGRTLTAMGQIARDRVSLQSIRAWLTAHPALARMVMESDQSFVFFKETPIGDPALGAAGSQGVTLTPDASLALDPRLHALGAPFYLATEVPDGTRQQAWQRLLIAQDTGGAIRGARRGDIFFGFGEVAAARAGAMKSPGRFFVLLPLAVGTRLGVTHDFPP